jgi:hypothetical protein
MAGSLILINGLVRMRWPRQRSIDSLKEKPKSRLRVCIYYRLVHLGKSNDRQSS